MENEMKERKQTEDKNKTKPTVDKKPEPVEEPKQEYEIEEGIYEICCFIIGEDLSAAMREIMGFGSFSSTKVFIMNSSIT